MQSVPADEADDRIPDMIRVGPRERGSGRNTRERCSVKDFDRARPDDGGGSVLFTAFFHSNVDSVLAYALRRSDAHVAQEVVAETFAIAWRRFDDIPNPALPWLLGVARRVLANSRRASSRQEALALRLVERPSFTDVDPTGEIDLRLTARAALERLSPTEREALELLAWEDLSAAEAAEVLGCSRRVFALRVHRGRKRLRQYLSDSADHVEVSTGSPRPAGGTPDHRTTHKTREAKGT
jgi:RNA polymerase sigma-70 factor (ECF subfamily)